MEVLIKLSNETDDGIIKATKGCVKPDTSPLIINFCKYRECLRVSKIYSIYAAPDGLYAVYSVGDIGELVNVADAVAPRPPELKPIAAKIRNFVRAVCNGEKFDDFIDDDCQPVYEYIDIQPRELPVSLITRENLRDVLVRHLDLKTALYYDALRHIAPSVLKLVPLCDESGELTLSEYDYIYYCRIGERAFVKKRLGEPFYEIPKEWLQGLEVKRRKEHPGVEELRRIFGLEIDARQLISYVAQQLGLAEEQRYVHTAKYCIAPDVELSSHRQLVEELYGGIIKVFRDYRLLFGEGDCTDVPSPYGVYTVICTTLQQHECEAWRVRDIDATDPPDVITNCIEACECSHELLRQMPAEKREEVLKTMKERLRDMLERGRDFDAVKCFPPEVLSQILGTIASYEEAEAKWRRAVEEIERKREEERRRLEEEKRRKREERKREILSKIRGLPLKVDVRDYAVYVTFAKRLRNDEFQSTVKTLKELGFRFDWRDKVWYYEL